MDLRELLPKAREHAAEIELSAFAELGALHSAVIELKERRDSLQASLDKVSRQLSENDSKLEDVRARRGARLADGVSASAEDKEAGAHRCERERLQDHAGALSERISGVQIELGGAHKTLLSAKVAVLSRALQGAQADAFAAKESYEFASAVRDIMQQKVNAYVMGAGAASANK